MDPKMKRMLSDFFAASATPRTGSGEETTISMTFKKDISDSGALLKADFKPVTDFFKVKPKQYDCKKEFVHAFRDILSSGRHHPHEVWEDFVIMTSCSLANMIAPDAGLAERREKRYLKCREKYTANEIERFADMFAETVAAFAENPLQDFLGDIYTSFNLTSKNLGQVFTPYNVCELMSALLISNVVDIVKEKGYVAINDPCCGSGAMSIAAVNEVKEQLAKAKIDSKGCYFVVAEDIDQTVVLMCYIQLSILNAPALIRIGNVLTQDMAYDDCWLTPACYLNPAQTGRILHDISNKN